MIFRLDNVKLNIFDDESKLLSIANRKAGGEIKYFKILKKSLDARDKENIFWVYSIAFSKSAQTETAPIAEKINSPRKVGFLLIFRWLSGKGCLMRFPPSPALRLPLPASQPERQRN